LAVGIVVDDAIMVLENIFRHRELGKDPVRAAREGTHEITFAALAATLAVVAIFVPVVFMKGVVGKYFLQFGVTLCVAVLLSYVEAVTLAPARCAQLLTTPGHASRGRLGRAVDEGFDRLALLYDRVLRENLRHPTRALLGAVALLFAAFFTFRSLPGEFVPSQDQSRVMVRLVAPVGSSLEEADRAFRQAEAVLMNRPEVERTFLVGGMGQVNQGMAFVTLKPPGQRALSTQGFFGVLRKELNGIPGLRAMVLDPSQSGFTGSRSFPVEFSVRGGDWAGLVEVSQKVREQLVGSGLVVDLDSDYQIGAPELRIVPDRARANDLGVSVEDVATTLRAQVGGVRAGKYSTGGRRIDVRLRLLANQRSRPEDITRLKVRSQSGEMIPL
jgi:multidrug efflux pump subunit AcrB